MKIEIGSEKKFFDFIGRLSDTDKIALISHNDLDGITAAKVANKVIDANIVKFVNYIELNMDLAEELKKLEVTKIIFTDIFMKEKEFVKKLEEFAEVLIVDHHLSPDWNSVRTTFVKCEEGYSCGYMCYELFGKVTNLEKLDWIVACSCVSDYCHKKPAEWLGKIYEKYGDKLEYVGDYVRKNGKFWDLQYTISLALIYFDHDIKKVFDSIKDNFGEIGDLRHHAKEVNDEINKVVAKFDKDKEEFAEGYIFFFKPKFRIGSVVSNIVSQKVDKTLIIIREADEDRYSISARRQDKKKDMNQLLVNLLKGLEGASGGGHFAAGGGHFLKKDLEEVKKRLKAQL